MTAPRKNEIPKEHLQKIAAIGNRVKELRVSKDLSMERFCSRYEIPRITYGNLEKGQAAFQITTLLTVLDVHELDLSSFFEGI